MSIQPYLTFGGRCQEAVDFYREALGAEVQMLMRFKEAPDQPPPGMVPDNWGDKIMHCSLKIGEAVLMASDGCAMSSEKNFQGFSLSLTAANEAEADRKFAALSARGVGQRLEQIEWPRPALRPFAILDPSVPKDARDILEDVVEIGLAFLAAF